MAAAPKKCICCNWNYADYSANVGGSTEYYCQECKKLHSHSSKFPNKELQHKQLPSPPINPQPYQVSL